MGVRSVEDLSTCLVNKRCHLGFSPHLLPTVKFEFDVYQQDLIMSISFHRLLRNLLHPFIFQLSNVAIICPWYSNLFRSRWDNIPLSIQPWVFDLKSEKGKRDHYFFQENMVFNVREKRQAHRYLVGWERKPWPHVEHTSLPVRKACPSLYDSMCWPTDCTKFASIYSFL